MSNLKSMKGAQIWIGPAITGDLTQAEFEALTYVKVAEAGTIGALGSTEEIIKFSPLEGTDRKAKGNVDAGDIPLTWGRSVGDPGQTAMKEAGLTNFCYAMKFVLNDAPAANYSKTALYTSGIVSEVKKSGGSGNDFIKDETTIGAIQRMIEVEPAVIP